MIIQPKVCQRVKAGNFISPVTPSGSRQQCFGEVSTNTNLYVEYKCQSVLQQQQALKMSNKVHKISNKSVDHTLRHIKQLQKILPAHRDKTPEKPTPPQFEPEKTEPLEFIAPSTPDVQPWLQDLEASSQTVKKQQSIRRQINFILGVEEEEGKEEALEIQKPDGRKIAKKLQKYQPANSSFSPFLSEKKSFEKRKAQEALERPSLPGFSLKGLNLPPIPLPNSYRQAQLLSARLIPKQRKRAASTRNVAFISQIRHIYNLGETTSEFPGQLIHKIDSATKRIDKKFDELNTKAADMMADVGNYHLEEESDRNYKNSLLSIPRWIMKKK